MTHIEFNKVDMNENSPNSSSGNLHNSNLFTEWNSTWSDMAFHDFWIVNKSMSENLSLGLAEEWNGTFTNESSWSIKLNLEDSVDDTMNPLTEISHLHQKSMEGGLAMQELLEFVSDFHIMNKEPEYSLSRWNAVWFALALACISVIVYGFFMRTLHNSEMDKVFLNVFKVQATHCLIDAFFTAVCFSVAAIFYMTGEDRVLACRFFFSVCVTFKLSFKFSLLIIGLTRAAYIIAPLYFHNLSKTVLQMALYFGWSTFFVLTFCVIFFSEIWVIPGFYYCLDINMDDLPHQEFLWWIIRLLNVITVLVYIFILRKRFDLKVPLRQQQREVRNRATLVTCMVQFAMQVVGFLPHLYFFIQGIVESMVDFYTITVLFVIMNQSIFTPFVLIILMTRKK